MPLLDHFHEPIYPARSWESFHSRWANSIADWLHEVLPERYFAEVQTHLGPYVEADVAEFDAADTVDSPRPADPDRNGGPAAHGWSPPAATAVLPAVFPDEFQVEVRDAGDGGRLVAVVELVSPGNKDRPDKRRAFAAKSLAYLERGVGLVVADIVTSYRASLHDETVRVMGLDGPPLTGPGLYAAAYRPVRRGDQNLIDVWLSELRVGGPLGTMPLGLRGAGLFPLDLEKTYADACRRSRL